MKHGKIVFAKSCPAPDATKPAAFRAAGSGRKVSRVQGARDARPRFGECGTNWAVEESGFQKLAMFGRTEAMLVEGTPNQRSSSAK